MNTGFNFFNNLMNSGLLGMGYQSITGNPMFGSQQQSQRNIQNANMLNTPTFQDVPEQKGNWFSGYQPSIMTSSPYTGNQQNMMNMLGKMGMQGLQTGQVPGGMGFDPIKQAYEQNYRQNVMPSIAERFAGLGGEGGAGSSGFKASMLGAENQLQTQLASMQSQFQLPMLMQMLGIGLKPQYEQQLIPAQGGFGQQLGTAAASALPYLPLLFL
jgi:hypothetical protein